MARQHKRLLGTTLVLLLVGTCALGCRSDPPSPPSTQPAAASPATQSPALPTANVDPPIASPPATESPALPTAAADSPTTAPAPTSPPAPPTADTGSPAAALAAELDGLDLDAFFEVSFRALMMRNPEGVLAEGVADYYGLRGRPAHRHLGRLHPRDASTSMPPSWQPCAPTTARR